MLSGLDLCVNLKILDLSYNRLSTVDPIKGCVKLEKLWLQGNQIKDMQSLTRTAPAMDNLKLLYLQEFNGEGMNACCLIKGYRAQVLKLFKSLSCLDGQRTSLATCVDMQDLGYPTGTDEGELDYDMQGQVFYSDEVTNLPQVNKVQIGADVKREIVSFDNLVAECESLLTRKTNIL